VRSPSRPRAPYPSSSALLRAVYHFVSTCVWLVSLGGHWRRHGTVVLCYHGVSDDQRERFDAQMRLISGRAGGASVLDQPATGRGRPDVLVTFDDAFENLLVNALPSLRRHGVPCLIFAVSDQLGSRPRWSMAPDHPDRDEMTMSASQLEELARADDVTIGSHSATHARLDQLSRGDLRKELASSREVLARICGTPIDHLAAPYGALSDEVIDAADRAGYAHVLSLCPSIWRSRSRDVGRFSVSPDVPLWTVRLTIDGAYGWLGWARTGLRCLLLGQRGRASARIIEEGAVT